MHRILDRTEAWFRLLGMNQIGFPTRSVMRWRKSCFVTVAVVSATSALAQGRGGNPAQIELVRSNYTKFEYRIAMRDGIKLFTSVYAPKDSSQPYPIMLMRTPYGVGPYGADTYRGSLGPSDLFAKEGFIFVYQDVRGRGQSEGEFDDPPAHKLHFSGPTDADKARTVTTQLIGW